MSNFGIFYDACSPNMAMSCVPRSKFRKNCFLLILRLILGKAAKFLVEKLSTLEVISQKPHRGVENTPPVLLGLMTHIALTKPFIGSSLQIFMCKAEHQFFMTDSDSNC